MSDPPDQQPCRDNVVRLGRDAQYRIAKVLREFYRGFVEEKLPERLMVLVRQLPGGEEKP
jgi:hypothetical protein